MGKKPTEVQGQRGLFPAAPHLSDAARYPRGYAPQRMADVTEALTRRSVRYNEDTDRNERVTESAVQPLGLRGESGMVRGANALHHRAVHETLARSTVPTEDMRLPKAVYSDWQELDSAQAHGVYHPPGMPVNQRPNEINVTAMEAGDSRNKRRVRQLMRRHGQSGTPGTWKTEAAHQDATQITLVHELGHAVSFHDPDRDHLHTRRLSHMIGDSRGGHIHGPEEAFADDYMLKHYRQDPRSRAMGNREPPHTYLSSGTIHPDTSGSYANARQVPLRQDEKSPRQRSAERVAALQTAAAESGRTGEQEGLPDVARHAVIQRTMSQDTAAREGEIVTRNGVRMPPLNPVLQSRQHAFAMQNDPHLHAVSASRNT